MLRYSAEAERVGAAFNRPPLDALAFHLNRLAGANPAELEEQPAGQWESMLAAMTNGRRR